MKFFRTVTITLFCTLTCVSLSTAKTSLPQAEVKSPTGAAIRSALFPGWGQFYNQKPLKGSLLLCTESFFLTRIVLEERHADISTSHRRRRNTFIFWWSAIKLYAIIDAYVDAHLWGLDREEGPLAFGVTPEIGTNQIMLFCQFCF